MTQTSIQALLDQAYDLAAALGRAMDTVKNTLGPIQPDEWHELKIAADAASLAASQLYQIIKRERAADEPVPYTLAIPGACLVFAHSGACEVRGDGTHTHPDNVR